MPKSKPPRRKQPLRVPTYTGTPFTMRLGGWIFTTSPEEAYEELAALHAACDLQGLQEAFVILESFIHVLPPEQSDAILKTVNAFAADVTDQVARQTAMGVEPHPTSA